MWIGLRHARDRGETGSAALEFALVMPLLLLVLFGILNYGLWFSDTLGVRQGVREASRSGVVENYGDSPECGATYASTPSPNLQKLVCLTKDRSSALTGETYVKVVVPEGWQRGRPLLVCAMVQGDIAGRLVPLPGDGLVTVSSRMSIEVATPGQLETGGEEVPPVGTDWAWCT